MWVVGSYVWVWLLGPDSCLLWLCLWSVECTFNVGQEYRFFRFGNIENSLRISRVWNGIGGCFGFAGRLGVVVRVCRKQINSKLNCFLLWLFRLISSWDPIFTGCGLLTRTEVAPVLHMGYVSYLAINLGKWQTFASQTVIKRWNWSEIWSKVVLFSSN